MSVVFEWKTEDFDKLVANCPDEPVTPYVTKYFPTDCRLLEAGCGSGRFVYYFGKLGYQITGIELGADTVRNLNSLHPDLDIIPGDITALPFRDNSFDGILSLGVIEHVSAGIEVPLLEMYRVLKSGGYALVIVPSWNRLRSIKYPTGVYHLHAMLDMLRRSETLRRLFGKPPLHRQESGTEPCRSDFQRWPLFGEFHEYRFTPIQFETQLRNAGFTVVESVPTSLIDGIHHEFGPLFAPLKDHIFYPTAAGRWLNKQLSKLPFFHNHMHLCVVQK